MIDDLDRLFIAADPGWAVREIDALRRRRNALFVERDRYREALDEILEQVGTSDSLPPDLTIKAIENIAEHALHPEETD